MRKYIGGLLVASLLSATLSAGVLDTNNSYDKEFTKMNQYFNSLVDSHFNNARLNNFNYPRMDIKDSKKQIRLKFDLAGVPKENIKLSINEDNVLTLEGEKKSSIQEKSQDKVTREIFYGKFKRVVQLPDNIEQNTVKTTYNNGILTITIVKKEIIKPKAKIIPIQ
jgi:HSP20 family protein